MRLNIIAMLLALAISSAPAYADMAAVSEGAPPPNFTLMNQDGEWVDMSAFFHKPTILYFTHNACHYCTQVIYHLKNAEIKFGKENFQIIGINVMAKDKRLVRAYQEALGFTYPMLAGNKAELLKAYHVNYVPIIIFIDAKGIVRSIVEHYINEEDLEENIKRIIGQ